jgi:cell division protein FtsI (penicillin-binding protein 3)
MDSPSYQFHFGTTASAPVFQALAQQILEYLGVPHDQPMKPANLVAANQKSAKPEEDDEPQEHPDDLDSLFAEVNNLPADDPLRKQVDDAARKDASPQDEEQEKAAAADMASTTQSDAALLKKKDAGTAAPVVAQQAVAAPPLPPQSATPLPAAKGSVSVPNQRVSVPSFSGLPVRKVVEQAGAAGLGVQVLGSGIARRQVPAAGTMVPAGTEVVVSFSQ